jgi:tetratricopeptide (TPR) repeat protein
LLLGLASARRGTAREYLFDHGADAETLTAAVRAAWTARGSTYVPLGEQYLSAFRAMAAGRIDEAISCWRTIAGIRSPNTPNPQLEACRTLSNDSNVRDEGLLSFKALLDAVNDPTERARVQSEWAEVMVLQPAAPRNLICEAEEMLRASLQVQRSEDDREASLGSLALALIRQSRFEEAAPYARESLQQIEARPAPNFLSYPACLALGGANTASALYAEALPLSRAQARCTLALALIGSGLIAEAKELLDEARELDPSVPLIQEVERSLVDSSN